MSLFYFFKIIDLQLLTVVITLIIAVTQILCKICVHGHLGGCIYHSTLAIFHTETVALVFHFEHLGH